MRIMRVCHTDQFKSSANPATRVDRQMTRNSPVKFGEDSIDGVNENCLDP
jgi:hypothetical protein